MTDLYAAYIRISRLADGDHSTAPEQRAAIESWMSQHYPAAKIRWYEDIDQSGRSEARPDWQRLLNDLADPAMRGVVVFNYTKTHRDVRGFLSFYDDHLAPRGQKLIDISNPYLNLSSADGRMQGTIFAAVAEHHARKTSELMTATLDSIRHRDGRHLGRIPFGADRDPETMHLIPAAAAYIIDSHHADARPWTVGDYLPPGWQVRRFYDSLRRLYEIYAADDLSHTQTAVSANREGWRYWAGDRRTPVEWNNQNACRVLQLSHLYASGLQPDGWTAKHAPLLDPDLCAQVVWRVASRSGIREPRHNPTRIYLLTGLIYCGHCGNRMSGRSIERRGKLFGYYTHNVRQPYCPQVLVPLAPVETDILERLAALPDMFTAAMLPLLDNLTAAAEPAAAPRLAGALAELERLIDLHIGGLITQEQFIRRRDPLQHEIERLQKSQPLQFPLSTYLDTLAALSSIPVAPAARRDLIRACIQRIEVSKKTVSRVEYQPWLGLLQSIT